ncbi:MAG TPA: NB-ARC domain-containing protein [Coleofasciculaceae cyanobacterium]
MNTIRASAKGLETINRLRRQKGWNRQSQAWCQEAFTTLATLRRFWRGEPIQQETFIRICQVVGIERWEEIVEGVVPSSGLQLARSDGMPDVSIFYGRTDELAKLTQWIIDDRCRLIALLGMGGIGKSALAAKLAEQLAPQFEYLIWRSLRYTPSIEKLLSELTQLLSTRTDSSPSDTIAEQVSSLIEGLQRHRVLLVLDDWETVLSSGDFAGHYRDGYKSYGDLLKRVGQESHRSCLLLTSREKTPEVSLLEGRTSPVRSLSLNGLGEAAQEILRAEDLSGEEQWSKLIQIYRGNPLVLQVIATFVEELFGGNVAEFLRQGMTLITGDLSRFLKQLFERLSPLERQVMQQLAQAQEPIMLQKLREALPGVSHQDLLTALQSLWWRSLIERSATGAFTVQPVVAEYTIHSLRWASGEEDSM